jgi:hypothetical protein
MTSADLYRRYAADCIRVAQQINNATDKATLLQMAEIWRNMAERIEKNQKSVMTDAAQNNDNEKRR